MTTIDLPHDADRGEARQGHKRALALLKKGTDGQDVAPESIALPPEVVLTEEVRTGIERANKLVLGALAGSTTAKYRRDWSLFAGWCQAQGLVPLPCSVATLAAFLGHFSGPHKQALRRRNGKVEEIKNGIGLAPQRLEGYRAAIRWVHDLAQEPTPTGDRLISRLMLGVRRAWEQPTRKSLAITTYGGADDEQGLLQRLAGAIDTSTLTGLRDRALLLTAFFGAMRRSELCAMQVGHLDKSRSSEGWIIRIPVSKGDKRREGQRASLPRRLGTGLCPVEALEAWLDAARRAGAVVGRDALVFRGIDRWGHVSASGLNPASVALIYKRLGQAAGLTEEQVAEISGHSTRAGYANSAILSGASIPATMAKLRHKDPKTLMAYLAEHDLLDDAVDADALAGKRRRGKRAGGPPEDTLPD